MTRRSPTLRRPPDAVLQQVLTYGRLDFPRNRPTLLVAPRPDGAGGEPNWWVPAVADGALDAGLRETIARVVDRVQRYYDVSWDGERPAE